MLSQYTYEQSVNLILRKHFVFNFRTYLVCCVHDSLQRPVCIINPRRIHKDIVIIRAFICYHDRCNILYYVYHLDFPRGPTLVEISYTSGEIPRNLCRNLEILPEISIRNLEIS